MFGSIVSRLTEHKAPAVSSEGEVSLGEEVHRLVLLVPVLFEFFDKNLKNAQNNTKREKHPLPRNKGLSASKLKKKKKKKKATKLKKHQKTKKTNKRPRS